MSRTGLPERIHEVLAIDATAEAVEFGNHWHRRGDIAA